MAACTLRVLVADDNENVRNSICQILHSQPDIEVVCEAADGTDTVNKIREHQPDVVLLDITMPTMNGLEAAAIIQREFPLGSGSNREPARFAGISVGRISSWRERLRSKEQRRERPNSRTSKNSRSSQVRIDSGCKYYSPGAPTLLILLDTTGTVGAPSFAVVAKGGYPTTDSE